MFKRIHHIGIVVRNLDEAMELYSKNFGFDVSGPVKTITELGMRDAMVSNGSVTLELMEPTGPESPMAKFIEKNGEGLHHISFEVEDVDLSMNELTSKGVSLLGREAITLEDAKLTYVHPKSARGVLIEVVQPLEVEN